MAGRVWPDILADGQVFFHCCKTIVKLVAVHAQNKALPGNGSSDQVGKHREDGIRQDDGLFLALLRLESASNNGALFKVDHISFCWNSSPGIMPVYIMRRHAAAMRLPFPYVVHSFSISSGCQAGISLLFFSGKDSRDEGFTDTKPSAMARWKSLDIRSLTSLAGSYSKRDNYLLDSSEYSRFMRNWESRKNNHFTRRQNGGVLIDMGNLLVYTDRKGAPQHVLEVLTDDLWTDNDIVQKAVLLETEGYDIDEQQEILENTCGAGSFRFRVPGDRSGNRGKVGTRKGQNSRKVRRTNREEQSAEGTSAEVQVKQTSLRDTEYLSAVESGDMEKAQRMVDEAAEKRFPDIALLTKSPQNVGKQGI